MSVQSIQWNDDRHTIVIRSLTVVLTPTEYRLLCPLRHGTPVTYHDLAIQAYRYAFDENVRSMMDKHIDRIRGKLRGIGIYLYCVHGYGYVLLPEVSCGKAGKAVLGNPAS